MSTTRTGLEKIERDALDPKPRLRKRPNQHRAQSHREIRRSAWTWSASVTDESCRGENDLNDDAVSSTNDGCNLMISVCMFVNFIVWCHCP